MWTTTNGLCGMVPCQIMHIILFYPAVEWHYPLYVWVVLYRFPGTNAGIYHYCVLILHDMHLISHQSLIHPFSTASVSQCTTTITRPLCIMATIIANTAMSAATNYVKSLPFPSTLSLALNAKAPGCLPFNNYNNINEYLYTIRDVTQYIVDKYRLRHQHFTFVCKKRIIRWYH